VAIKNRQTILMIVAGAALVLLVGDSLILTPLRAGWKERSDQINKLELDVKNGNALLQQKRWLENRWAKMQSNTLPTDPSLARSELLKALERWEQDSRLKIDRIAPQWKTGDDYTTLECRVDASGTMDAALRFIYDIEKGPMGLKVDVVEISARDNNGQQLSLGLQLTGLILTPAKQQ
jgi:hypothetical protein